MNFLNDFFFVAFPYIAITVFVAGAIYRYKFSKFTVSSLSSQFIGGKANFWAVVPFHIGILVLFLGHLNVFVFPDFVIAWNSDPTRLIIHEGIAFAFGVSVFFAMLMMIFRRAANLRLRVVTSKMDVAIEILLLIQVILGCWIALGYRWGSSWFAADLTPYLRSIFGLAPQTDAVNALPLVIKLHIIGAFAIIFMIPFTRLMHFLVAPFHYIGRPHQIVRWNWNRKTVRDAGTAWQETRPKNN